MEKYLQRKSFQFHVKFDIYLACFPNIPRQHMAKISATFFNIGIFHFSICHFFLNTYQLVMSQEQFTMKNTRNCNNVQGSVTWAIPLISVTTHNSSKQFQDPDNFMFDFVPLHIFPPCGSLFLGSPVNFLKQH